MPLTSPWKVGERCISDHLSLLLKRGRERGKEKEASRPSNSSTYHWLRTQIGGLPYFSGQIIFRQLICSATTAFQRNMTGRQGSPTLLLVCHFRFFYLGKKEETDRGKNLRDRIMAQSSFSEGPKKRNLASSIFSLSLSPPSQGLERMREEKTLEGKKSQEGKRWAPPMQMQGCNFKMHWASNCT